MKIYFPSIFEMVEGYSSNIPLIITNVQLYKYGIGGDGEKMVGTAKVKGVDGVYSIHYEPIKRKRGLRTDTFNLRLTGKLHGSYKAITAKNEVKIYADTFKNRFDLRKKYPNAFKTAAFTKNVIIKGGEGYPSLTVYCRQYFLKHFKR